MTEPQYWLKDCPTMPKDNVYRQAAQAARRPQHSAIEAKPKSANTR